MSPHLVRAVAFDPDGAGVVVEFVTPALDVRSNGLVMNHTLLIPADGPFAELVEELEMSAQRALRLALQMHEESQPLPSPEDAVAPSPYDNPADLS